MKYNILIIGIETCRKDVLQCYNSSRNTPNIQQFANKSMVFDNFYTNASNTYESLGCMFSGLYPYNSKISLIRKDELSKNLKLIDKVFLDNGYYVKIGKFGSKDKPLGNEIDYSNSEPSLDIKEPFFIFEGGTDLCARAPYGFTEHTIHSKEVSDILESHAKCIEKVDCVINNYISKYEKYKNTIIILTSDHGDKITKGNAGHYDNIDNETINIPLIMYHPDINKHRKIPYMFSMIDIFPTLSGMCNIKIDNYEFDGKDLSDYILNDVPFPDRTIQIGPTAGCKESKTITQNINTNIRDEPIIKERSYTRRHILMRMSDYTDREYVNKVMSQLENSNYFDDEWVSRSTTYNNLEHAKNRVYINSLVDFINVHDIHNTHDTYNIHNTHDTYNIHNTHDTYNIYNTHDTYNGNKSITLLDDGAGTGNISIEILKRRPDTKIYAIDQCFSMLNQIPHTEETKTIERYVADIEKMSFIEDKSIDKIICNMVIHSNIDILSNILEEFKRVLKDDGEIIISEVVTIDDSKSIVEFNECFFHEKEDRTIMTRKIFDDNLKNHNLQIIESKEFILKNVSIKSWLRNSCINNQSFNKIYNMFKDALLNSEIKNKMNLVYIKGNTEEDDDIYRDWKFLFIKAIKHHE